jgi:hypothetical protein
MVIVTIDDFKTLQLRCKDCGTPFIITAKERLYFFEHSLSDPVRCVNCRQERKNKLVDTPQPDGG